MVSSHQHMEMVCLVPLMLQFLLLILKMRHHQVLILLLMILQRLLLLILQLLNFLFVNLDVFALLLFVCKDISMLLKQLKSL